MHPNIETAIDRFLVKADERGIIADLEPLRIRVVGVMPRVATAARTVVVSVNLADNAFEEETNGACDGTVAQG